MANNSDIYCYDTCDTPGCPQFCDKGANHTGSHGCKTHK